MMKGAKLGIGCGDLRKTESKKLKPRADRRSDTHSLRFMLGRKVGFLVCIKKPD